MVLQLPKYPKCPLCVDHHSLQLISGRWTCDRTGFYFNVINGVPGRPMWVQPGEEAVSEAPQPVKEETFEGWLSERGVTPEMYKDQDDKTKEDLRTAFYQRGRKDADMALLPPR